MAEYTEKGLKKGEVDLGTSIMAVAFDGGVVLGADSRTSAGSYIVNRVSDKLTAIHDRVYCCRSGSAADTQAISDYVRHFIESHSIDIDAPPKVETVATMFKTICYENKDALMAGIIIAGCDKYSGGSVYTINLGGTMMKQPYAIGGSGSTYIYGYCDSAYRPGMTQEECERFVLNSLTLAMARDGSSGGVVRMVVITPEGVERKFFSGAQLPNALPAL